MPRLNSKKKKKVKQTHQTKKKCKHYLQTISISMQKKEKQKLYGPRNNKCNPVQT